MAMDNDDKKSEDDRDQREQDDDEQEAAAEREARKRAASAGAARAKGGGASAKESDRKKRELITIGKAKGFLTYDEVNEHLPENIVSSDQMDDWLTAFSGEGIELVDSTAKVKVADKGEAASAAADDEDEEEVEAEVAGDAEAGGKSTARDEDDDEEDAEGAAKTTDPVRLYLREISRATLLSGEQELALGKSSRGRKSIPRSGHSTAWHVGRSMHRFPPGSVRKR